MILSDTAIIEARLKGSIVIEPFELTHLGANSYDIRLGEWYFRPAEFDEEITIDFTRPEHVKRYWQGPRNAVRQDHGVIWIKRQETVLCHTIEVIGGTKDITCEMRARSSIGRAGLAIAKCAGMGDVGYIAKWTMEITNFTSVTIPLYVGMRVGQIIFHRVEGTVGEEYKGSYGQGEWNAADMLPKLTRW